MTITQITEENNAQLADLIPAETRSNLGREYFRGLAANNDNGLPDAVIVWEIKSLEDETEPTRAEILCFEASDRAGGEELLDAFEQSVQTAGIHLITFELDSMGEMPKSILSDSGYRLTEDESRDITVSVSEFSSLKLAEKSAPEYIRSLSDITSRQFKAAVMTSVFHGRYGLLDDLPHIPVTRFDPDISSCVITDDRVRGLLLVHGTKNGNYIVELLFSAEPDANINMLNMIRHSVRQAKRICSMDDRVILRTSTQAAKLLVKKLFPGKTGMRVIKGEKNTITGDE